MDFENQKCNTCHQSKPLDCFNKNIRKKNKHDGQCKECRKTYFSTWYQKNKDKVLSANKQYYKNNIETCLATRSRYAKANPEKYRKYSLKSGRKKLPTPSRPCPNYCEMCLRPAGKRALHLDHCHTTNTFRGWLCGGCNTAFGRLGDSFEIALERLERYKATIKQGEN